MSFFAAERLWLLLAVGAVGVAYVAVQRSRRRYALRFTNVELLASVAPRRPGWRRHLAAALLVVALGLLVVAFARPSRATQVPRPAATVMLAIDVSPSMAATDVKPSRIQAAAAAAKKFAATLPSRYRLGLVTFGGTATVAVAATTDRAPLLQALSHLQLVERTAIGEAVFAALGAIRQAPADHGKIPPARIVLLSDGSTNTGRSNDEAVRAARAAHVPVSTIAYGTQSGSVKVEGESVDVPVDGNALQVIADATGGHYASAASAQALHRTYTDLRSAIVHDTQQREITSWLVGAALVFALSAAGASLVWTARLP